jgi:hypothetical protein
MSQIYLIDVTQKIGCFVGTQGTFVAIAFMALCKCVYYYYYYFKRISAAFCDCPTVLFSVFAIECAIFFIYMQL